MSLSSVVIIRTILGVIFFALGVFVSRKVNPPSFYWLDNPYLFQTLLALIFGVFGVFGVPLLAERVKKWFEGLIRTTVARTLAEWTRELAKQARLGGKTARGEAKQMGTHVPVILDTSAIIDGRILEVARLGFLEGPFLVPEVVLNELQRLADSNDELKRQRGRRGLDILEEMRSLPDLKVTVVRGRRRSAEDEVDRLLIKLAQKRGAKIASVDFNLLKTASVSGVRVLNVNALAQSLRMVVLPGETLTIKIWEKGREPNQGVGFLEDGTMVVVEEGERYVGQRIKVIVTRFLQTEAGRMIFARPESAGRRLTKERPS